MCIVKAGATVMFSLLSLGVVLGGCGSSEPSTSGGNSSTGGSGNGAEGGAAGTGGDGTSAGGSGGEMSDAATSEGGASEPGADASPEAGGVPLYCKDEGTDRCMCTSAGVGFPPGGTCPTTEFKGLARCCADEGYPQGIAAFCECTDFTCSEGDFDCMCGTGMGTATSCAAAWTICCADVSGICHCDNDHTECYPGEVRVTHCSVDMMPCHPSEARVTSCGPLVR
jgi:hypothetical protein